MQKIWKFSIPAKDTFDLVLKEGAQVLTVQVQEEEPYIWVLLDPDAPDEAASFLLIPTGKALPDVPVSYVGTFQVLEGAGVFHLFRQEGRERHRD